MLENPTLQIFETFIDYIQSEIIKTRLSNLKFTTMKNLITLSAFFATFLTFGQTEKLVHYKIEANEHVKSFSAVARKHSKTNGWNHGNVESINGTTINLLLATDTDYKFMINKNS